MDIYTQAIVANIWLFLESNLYHSRLFNNDNAAFHEDNGTTTKVQTWLISKSPGQVFTMNLSVKAQCCSVFQGQTDLARSGEALLNT